MCCAGQRNVAPPAKQDTQGVKESRNVYRGFGKRADAGAV